jgi:hypothetical protein
MELSHSMITSHQKIQGFKSIKDDRVMPEGFNLNLKNLVKLIISMTEKDPSLRPSADDIYLKYLKERDDLFESVNLNPKQGQGSALNTM